jgi:hypothetical protein
LFRSDELLVKVPLKDFTNPTVLGLVIAFGIFDTFSFKPVLPLITVLEVFNEGFTFTLVGRVERFKLKCKYFYYY